MAPSAKKNLEYDFYASNNLLWLLGGVSLFGHRHREPLVNAIVTEYRKSWNQFPLYIGSPPNVELWASCANKCGPLDSSCEDPCTADLLRVLELAFDKLKDQARENEVVKPLGNRALGLRAFSSSCGQAMSTVLHPEIMVNIGRRGTADLLYAILGHNWRSDGPGVHWREISQGIHK